MRGHDDIESNFIQLFKLHEIDNPELSAWRLNRKADKYLSPLVQNEMLHVMSLSIMRSIATDLHSSDAFTVMADECTDVSNLEQLTICFCWVDTNLKVHEVFVGLYQIGNILAIEGLSSSDEPPVEPVQGAVLRWCFEYVWPQEWCSYKIILRCLL